jgi:hypothetical protein
VHALDILHTALRPGGLLLDVRPAPEHPWVEVARSSTGGNDADNRNLGRRDDAVRLGRVDDSYRMGTLATADAALQTAIDAGRFAREREQTFTFVYHFDSVPTWLAYMAEHWSTGRLSPDLIARAWRELPGKTADGGNGGNDGDTHELRILRAIRASRLRRL